MPPTRLNREQKKAATRQALLDAASEVFARDGLDGAALEEICDRAGYSRGAFYSNFTSKQQLFVEVLERRTADTLADVATAFTTGETLQQRMANGGKAIEAMLDRDRVWCQLHFEGWLLASRDEDFRNLYAQRYDTLREGLAAMIETEAATTADVEIDTDELAAALLALFQGYALQHVIDPGALPKGYFTRSLQRFLPRSANTNPATGGES